MKNKLFILLFVFLACELNPLFSQVSQAVSYFPLKVGNVWVYNCSAFGVNPPCYCLRKYRFEITGTTIKNNKNYFIIQGSHVEISPICLTCYAPPYPDTLRIDSTTGNIYEYSENGCAGSPFEILFDSLNARLHDTVMNNCSISQWRYICSDTSNQNIFGISRKTKGFSEILFESSFGRTFAQGIGIYGAGFSSLSCTQNFSILVGCVIDGVLYGDTSMLVGINQISTEIPEKFDLSQNYPNPFNPVTKIKFQIPSVGNGRDRSVIKIYNALGREVQVLVNESLQPGTYEVGWDGSNYPSGVYFYELTSGNFSQTRKMVLLK